VVNPRVGNALQHTRPDREEETGEVAQNHEAGTWMRRGSRIPKESSGRATGCSVSGSGLPGEQDDGGAIFGQSQERKLGQPGRRPNRRGGPRRGGGLHTNRSSSRRTGSRRERRREGRQVARTSPIRMCAPRMMVPRRPRRWRPPLLEGQGGRQRRPTSRDIILCLPSSPRAPCLHGVTDDEQEGGNPSRNGRSESCGEASQEEPPARRR
jgi:hypothetical protein